jgi:ERCC4-related helicase
MLAISQIEVNVKRFWGDLYKHIPKPEIDDVGGTFAESEIRHKDAYSFLLEQLGLNSEFENIFNIPQLMGRVEYLEEFMEGKNKDNKGFVLSLILFSLFVEHISLFGQFLILMSFNKEKNLFKGLSNIVEATSKEHKLEILTNLLSDEAFEKVLLFGETKFGVQRLSDHLEREGFTSVAIHGNKSQSQRQRALKSFKDNKVRIMVATDVAARGLDIPNVSHVINFDQPATYEDYVHRIGRTGRGTATGKALTFVDGK